MDIILLPLPTYICRQLYFIQLLPETQLVLLSFYSCRRQYWPSLTAWWSVWRDQMRLIMFTTVSWIVTMTAESQPVQISTTTTSHVSRRLLKVETRSVSTAELRRVYIHTYIPWHAFYGTGRSWWRHGTKRVEWPTKRDHTIAIAVISAIVWPPPKNGVMLG